MARWSQDVTACPESGCLCEARFGEERAALQALVADLETSRDAAEARAKTAESRVAVYRRDLQRMGVAVQAERNRSAQAQKRDLGLGQRCQELTKQTGELTATVAELRDELAELREVHERVAAALARNARPWRRDIDADHGRALWTLVARRGSRSVRRTLRLDQTTLEAIIRGEGRLDQDRVHELQWSLLCARAEQDDGERGVCDG